MYIRIDSRLLLLEGSFIVPPHGLIQLRVGGLMVGPHIEQG